MTLSSDPRDQERLVDLVRRALAAIETGEPVDPSRLCGDAPHLAQPLAEALGLAAQLPLLQGEALRRDPLAGFVLANRYRLLDCLGRGAMGVVYRADDAELHRAVAVKVLDARLLRDAQAQQRFAREAEALATLQHGNVVAVHDRGRTPEGIHFLVMELLEGATLAALIEAIGKSSDPSAALAAAGIHSPETHWPRVAACWARDLARGLGAAHERSLIHRDVKPSNVFVTRDGRPILIDFGLAARAEDQRLTATQTTLGTPWYMAPEQLSSGLGPPSPALDVYGLGATMYHLLGRRPPYVGDAISVLAALRHEDPEPLAHIRPNVPRDLRAIVEKCLRRDPAKRYPTANALADDLDRFLAHQPVVARPVGPVQRKLQQWRRAPARMIATAALILALLTALIAAPIWLQQRRDEALATKQELYATLPSLLAIEGWPDERVLAELHDEHRTAIDLLDRILTLDPDDLPIRLMRACLRLDLGDRDGAASDLRDIAERGDSEFLRAVADRYLQLDAQQSGAFAVDMSGLPAPITAQDCYVAGFHELRARHVAGFAQRADELLSRAADTYLPARDLRLIAWADLGDRRPEYRGRLHDETIRLETIYGRPTARTSALRGVALLQQRRYDEAVPELQRSLELRPERHGPHQNLGIAFLKLGLFDESDLHLQHALRLRPFSWNTRHTMAQLARTRGDFDMAYEITAGLAKTGARGESWMQPDLVGSIALEEAMVFLTSDRERSRRAAEKAVASYDEALAVRDSALARQRRAIAAALLQDDRDTRLVLFAKALLEDPSNPYQLANLAWLMPPAGLDAQATAWITAVIRGLAARGSAGDVTFRSRMEKEIDEGLKPFRR